LKKGNFIHANNSHFKFLSFGIHKNNSDQNEINFNFIKNDDKNLFRMIFGRF